LIEVTGCSRVVIW